MAHSSETRYVDVTYMMQFSPAKTLLYAARFHRVESTGRLKMIRKSTIVYRSCLGSIDGQAHYLGNWISSAFTQPGNFILTLFD